MSFAIFARDGLASKVYRCSRLELGSINSLRVTASDVSAVELDVSA
jgi:hypothetical protein